MVFSWRLQVQKTTRLRVLLIVERLFSLRQQVHKTTSAFRCQTTKDLFKGQRDKKTTSCAVSACRLVVPLTCSLKTVGYHLACGPVDSLTCSLKTTGYRPSCGLVDS